MEKIIKNKEISWKAKGLYMYIALAKDYELSAGQMVEFSTDGLHAVSAGLKELEKAGLLLRNRRTTGLMEYKLK